jgi:hypothetical protein
MLDKTNASLSSGHSPRVAGGVECAQCFGCQRLINRHNFPYQKILEGVQVENAVT